MKKDEAKIIHSNLEDINNELPEEITLCAITKYHDLDETKEVIKNGINNLGESKVQDLLKKIEEIDDPVNWHFIGHLQTNKVKYLVGKVTLIQSVDSLKVLKKINAESQKKGVITDILIQYNLTGEDQKYGFKTDQTQSWIETLESCPNVNVKGLMGMGPHTDNQESIRKVFKNLKEIYDKIDKDVDQDNLNMEILSMGMSGDYPIAIEEGANLVRIGSKIFS